MTEVFLLGSWLGGALCYSLVLVSGTRPPAALKVFVHSLLWPLSLAMVMLTPEARQ